MKKILTLVLLPVALATAVSSLRADQPPKLRKLAEAGAPEAKQEKRVFVHRLHEKPELETVAFLGVETTPVSPALTAQLGLPKDAGLVVRHVVPDSAAAGALQIHDVLLKLDDQLLIDSRQFAVLVRGHKEGDEVTLTYVRQGKQATVKVKLTTHEVPKMAFFGTFDAAPNHLEHGMMESEMLAPPAREEMDHVLSLLDQHGDTLRAHAIPPPRHKEGRYRAMSLDVANSNMAFNDDQGSLELTIKDGRKTLVAKNAKGEQLYAGPIDTPEQRKALPEEVRARLDKLEGMQEFSFEPDGKFRTDVQMFHASPSEISLSIDADSPGDPVERPPVAAF